MTRSTLDLPSALAHLDDILGGRLDRSVGLDDRRLALFLDYDGTLTPIVDRPEKARLSAPMRELVAGLARSISVAIVSGRGLADARALVGLDELIYAGSHGFEIEGPAGSGLSHREGQSFAPTIEAVEAQLRTALADLPGALVERKALSVAVHYRLVEKAEVARVGRVVDDTLSRHPELHQGHGKCVYELQPALDWHKGKAVLWLIDRLEQRHGPLLPIYIGDDVTDENAFRALPEHGVGIVVCAESRETAATYSLESTEQVQRFLEQLAAASRH